MRLRTLLSALVLVAFTAMAGAGAARASNDQLFSKQWGLVQVQVPGAWARSTGAGVTIGIVDTGVFFQHEDLAGKVVASTSCVGGTCGGGSAQDDNGHGTHVSGIAAAYKDNGRGIAGVAPDAKLVVAKVLDSNGNGNPGDVANGIRWVVQHGARVVNLSLGDDPIARFLFGDPDFEQAIEDAWNAGAVPVVAAGNSSLPLFGSANYGALHALVVGATEIHGQRTGYSSPIGTAQWGVMAPGGDGSGDPNDIWSSIWDPNNPSATNTYATLAGTSMATPHVTGAVALLLAEGLGRDGAVQRIVGTAAPIAGCAASNCGHGLLNVAAAVGAAPPGGSAAGTSTGSGGGTATHPGGVRVAQPKTTAPTGRSSAPGTTAGSSGGATTSTSPDAAAAGGDGTLRAAGRPPSQVRTTRSGGNEGRVVQVGIAIALLGGAGVGLGLLARTLRAGAAP